MLSRYGNYFRSLPDPPCSRSSRLCLFSPRRLSGAAAGRFRVASPKASMPRVTLGGRCSARQGARGSRSRRTTRRFVRVASACCSASTDRNAASPVRDMASPLCRSCVVFEARFSFAFVPVRHRNHFCVGFSEPARLLSVGYEAEIRRTSSLGRGALSDFFSCAFSPSAARLPSAVMPAMGCSKRRLNPTQGQCV